MVSLRASEKKVLLAKSAQGDPTYSTDCEFKIHDRVRRTPDGRATLRQHVEIHDLSKERPAASLILAPKARPDRVVITERHLSEFTRIIWKIYLP